jgi:hypothetical protein
MHHAMITHQELSSQQVMSYLLDLEDHFTSHEFKNLFWTSCEAAVNSEDCSPECYQISDGDSKQCSQGMTSNETDEEVQDENEEPDRSADVDQEFPLADVIEHDEIGISLGDDDEIVAHSSQLTDYKCRSEVLQSLTLWEFCAQTEKVKAARVSEITDFEDMNLDNILMLPNKTRPTYRFKTPHKECYTHTLKILHPTSRRIPVLIGSVPRQYQPETYARYCHLMLILFRPWQTAFDLRRPQESWETVFDDFKSSTLCSDEFKQTMNNMQLLHECKDSHNDHFRECHNRQLWLAPEITGADTAAIEDALEGIDNLEIL